MLNWRRRDVAAPGRPAHDHEVSDLRDDLRVAPHRERDIGQRPDRDQRDLPGCAPIALASSRRRARRRRATTAAAG